MCCGFLNLHPLMMSRPVNREVNPAVIGRRRDMYTKQRVRLKIHLKQHVRPLDRTVPAKRETRPGAIASPCCLNNYVLEAQDQG